jgi:hypothetical protein
MPSIAYRSKTRAAADCCSLTLTVNHHILVGAASETVHYVNKAGFPRDVDVLARASIILNISGFCNGTQILAKDILDSSLAHYLVEYFQTVFELPLSLSMLSQRKFMSRIHLAWAYNLCRVFHLMRSMDSLKVDR